jgi:membrane-bound lytic murein transglycosylase D
MSVLGKDLADGSRLPMPVHASILKTLALSLALVLGLSAPVLGVEVGGPPLLLPAADSLRDPATGLRSAYETALQQRQAGDPASALRTIESALSALQTVRAADSETGARTDLADLQTRLSALYDATRQDLPNVQVEPGNEADEGVLNATAIDALGAIEPQDHELVTRWLDFFMGAGRSTFERWLKRSGRYMDLFRAVLQREGLPPDLVNLVFVESGFNLNARSVSAAVGPWQFLRSTGKFFGLTVDQWVDERKDPEKATVAAARYLKHLYGIFGDWPLALASYNAGEGTVLRAIKAQGTTNYWDLKLPRQTEDYVPQFMAALTIARDPARYGFDAVELDDPMAFDEVALKGPVDLRAVARLAECSYEELKTLNPAVLHTAARGSGGIVTLRVPPGKGEALMQRLQSGEPLPTLNLTLKHKVRKSETLQSIARQYSVNARDLARINGIGKKRPLRRGMLLTVPASLRAPTPEIIDPATDPRASTAYVPPRDHGSPATLDGHSTTEGRTAVVVEKGETLASIAERYGVSTQDLMRWNRLKSARVTHGMRLKVRTPAAIAADSARNDSIQIAVLRAPKPRASKSHATSSESHRDSPTGARVSHTVRRGETLSGIARQHGISVAALKRANELGTSRIRTGQRLRLPV